MSEREKNATPSGADVAILRELQTVWTDPTGDVDLEQLEHRMSLSPRERLRADERLARLVALLREGGERYGNRSL